MNPSASKPPKAPISVSDLIYAVFKHKWVVASCALAGLGAAAAFHLGQPKLYESQAKLLVRYVMERSAIDTVESQRDTSGRGGSGVIDSEIEIITSWDLAKEVAERVGPARIVTGAKAPPTVNDAAGAIVGNLEVVPARGSNVITISYRNRNPEVTQSVLNELVKSYFDRHLAVHRSVGAFDFVSQQADQVRSRLRETEEELRKLKSEAGIVSLDSSREALSARVAELSQQLLTAEASVAEQSARVKEISQWSGASEGGQTTTSASSVSVDPTLSQKYRSLLDRLTQLRQWEFTLSNRFTDSNPQVRDASARVAALEVEIRALEQKNPALLSTGAAIGNAGVSARPDPLAERAALVAAEARVAALRRQRDELSAQVVDLAKVGVRVGELERRRELEEANFKYLESSLERARVDEALDPSKIPNISIVQAPSPAFVAERDKDSRKILLALAAGGFALGLGFAVSREVVFDRSVKRPSELEGRIGLPQILSIPLVGRSSDERLLPGPTAGALKAPNGSSPPPPAPSRNGRVAPWEPQHFLHEYGAALRDRLIHLFEVEQLTHKPKMVGVTSASAGAGVSTIACSLAAALSETGDGKVLLVDVNTRNAATQRFFGGRPVGSITKALDLGGRPELKAPDLDNLYLASITDGNGATTNPRALYKMLPRFRASEFDYIIFDMPPVAPTSPTLAISGLLDKVILAVEAEKTSQHAVQRALRDLTAARADVVGLINKTRSRVPDWVEHLG